MNDNITVEYKDDYVHVQKSGPYSYDASLELWERIVAVCEEHSRFNILGESFTTKPPSTLEAFDHIKVFELVGVTRKHRIAWVHHVEETADSVQFVEMVLTNRGLVNGRLFPTVEEAMEWLLAKSKDNEPDASDD